MHRVADLRRINEGNRLSILLSMTEGVQMQLESILILSGVGLAFALFVGGLLWADIQTKLAIRQEKRELQLSSRRNSDPRG